MTIYNQEEFDKIHEDTEQKRKEALEKQQRIKDKAEEDKYAKFKQTFGE